MPNQRRKQQRCSEGMKERVCEKPDGIRIREALFTAPLERVCVPPAGRPLRRLGPAVSRLPSMRGALTGDDAMSAQGQIASNSGAHRC